MDTKLQDVKEALKNEVFTELRERKLRQRNVVMHRVGEAGPDFKLPEERKAWDLDSCDNIFKAMKTKVDSKTSVQFCRRVGERGENPRPMVVGFKNEGDREAVLDNAYNLRDTFFNDVSIVPDLTTAERKEEANLTKEAEGRNSTRTEEDCAKNLTWLVVGKRGERRLIKGVERVWNEAGRGRGTRTERGRGAEAWGGCRAAVGSKGRGWERTGRGRGSATGTVGGVAAGGGAAPTGLLPGSRATGDWTGPTATQNHMETEEEETAEVSEEEFLECQENNGQTRGRIRLNSKRTRDLEDNSGEEPPAKH